MLVFIPVFLLFFLKNAFHSRKGNFIKTLGFKEAPLVGFTEQSYEKRLHTTESLLSMPTLKVQEAAAVFS